MIKIGNKDIQAIYWRGRPILRAYKGEELVYYVHEGKPLVPYFDITDQRKIEFNKKRGMELGQIGVQFIGNGAELASRGLADIDVCLAYNTDQANKFIKKYDNRRSYIGVAYMGTYDTDTFKTGFATMRYKGNEVSYGYGKAEDEANQKYIKKSDISALEDITRLRLSDFYDSRSRDFIYPNGVFFKGADFNINQSGIVGIIIISTID